MRKAQAGASAQQQNVQLVLGQPFEMRCGERVKTEPGPRCDLDALRA